MTATSSPPSSSKTFALGVAAVVVLGIGIIAFLATQRDSAINSDAEPTAAIEIDGDALAPVPAASSGIIEQSTDPAVGQQAPTLAGTGFDGTELSVPDDGRPKAIYFIAHWCPHCQREVPVVQDLIDSGEVPDGVDLYAVSTAVDDTRPNFPPYLWLDQEGFEVPTLRDDEASSAYTSYGAGGFPYVVYLDGENRVVARSTGELSTGEITGMWQQLALTGSAEGDGDASGDADTAIDEGGLDE